MEKYYAIHFGFIRFAQNPETTEQLHERQSLIAGSILLERLDVKTDSKGKEKSC
jgi:hypothetical protein